MATGAAQVDLDVFGADLGGGVPVAAFQIKQADSDCCMHYAIYSLQKPPRWLRTIAGGEYFRASDIDLDGRVEIFTDDAAAVQNFDRLSAGELDFPPPLVLSFSNSRLEDVSAEFQPYFDQRIAELRAAISAHDLEEFEKSDGGLTRVSTETSAQDLHRLRTVKVKVLEIVWSYLYSGREKEAWQSLAEMWPAPDIDRIRSLLLASRARGIDSQVDGTAPSTKSKKRRAQIFDAIGRSEPGGALDVVPPRAILLQRPPILPQQREQEEMLELVVDQAGKVRSAQPAGPAKNVDAELINAALNWKFIPALRNGRAVASRLRIAVSGKK